MGYQRGFAQFISILLICFVLGIILAFLPIPHLMKSFMASLMQLTMVSSMMVVLFIEELTRRKERRNRTQRGNND